MSISTTRGFLSKELLNTAAQNSFVLDKTETTNACYETFNISKKKSMDFQGKVFPDV